MQTVANFRMSIWLRMRRAIGLTVLLAAAEYFFLLAAIIGMDLLSPLFGREGYGGGPSPDTVTAPFYIAAFKLVRLSYPLTAAILFAADRAEIPRIGLLWRLMAASVAGYIALRTTLALGFGAGLPSHHAERYSHVIGAAAVIAPLIVGGLAGGSIRRLMRVMARTKRAVFLTALLIPVEYVLIAVFIMGLEYGFVAFGPFDGNPKSTLLEEDDWAGKSLIFAAIAVYFRFLFSNYQIVAALLMVFGGVREKRQTGFFRFLIINVAGCVLSLGLFSVWDDNIIESLMVFDAQASWGASFLYPVAGAVIAAPIIIRITGRRVGWLGRLFDGL